jgi:hypothetical protein
MELKTKLSAVGAILTGTVGNALAAANNTSLSLERGQQNIMGLPYANFMQWILDSMYFIVNRVALLAILYITLRILLGGWDSLEAEIRGRKAFTLIICALAVMKIGIMAVDLIQTA